MNHTKQISSIISLTVLATISLCIGISGIVLYSSPLTYALGAVLILMGIGLAFFTRMLVRRMPKEQSPLDPRQVNDLLAQANSMIDITKRLRVDQKRLLELLQFSDQACWIRNEDGLLSFTNLKFNQISGVSAQTLNEQSETPASPLISTINQLDKMATEQGVALKNQVQYQGQTLELKVAPLNDKSETVGWMSVNTDPAHWELIDPKTRIGNLEFAVRWLDEGIQQSSQEKEAAQMAVLVLSINQFDDFVSEHSFTLAGQCLTDLGMRLASLADDHIQVARLTRDRFAIMLRDIQDKDHILQTLQTATNELSEPMVKDGAPITFSFSAGLAQYPENAVDSWQLIRAAEKDMIDSNQLLNTH